MANGRTNRPIARLYPLEVSADERSSNVNTEESAQLQVMMNLHNNDPPGGLWLEQDRS